MPLPDQYDKERTIVSTKRRAIPFIGSRSRYVSWSRDVCPPPAYSETKANNVWSPTNLQGMQETASENHPSWKRRLGTAQDIGGNFSTTKKYVKNQAIPVYRLSGSKSLNSCVSIGYDYQGPVLVDALINVSFPPGGASTNSVLDAVGAGAIADVKPTNSVASLATALAELYREGLPRAVGSSFWKKGSEQLIGPDGSFKPDLINHSAEEYLNLQFGIKPIIGDILDFARGVSQAGLLVKQFQRDAGKVVRRRMSFAPTGSEVTTLFKDNVPAPYTLSSTLDMYSNPNSTPGKVYRVRKTTQRRWFSGAFTYHLGMDPYSLNRMEGMQQDANHLLGLDITPETLYNLAPWSWAVDWVSSLGDVVSNLTDHIQYGLVMPYGYLMEHTIVSDTYYWSGPTNLKVSTIVPSPITLVTETKLRRKANPYGFGLTWNSLSTKQQAILAALGITKSGH